MYGIYMWKHAVTLQYNKDVEEIAKVHNSYGPACIIHNFLYVALVPFTDAG